MSATSVADSTEAAEAAVEAITSAASKEVSFSLALTQDQKDVRDWVHGFAADVIRPAAHEWDEKEQTPWPIIQEAAKIGLYGFEGLAQFFADPTGLTLPIVNEELFFRAVSAPSTTSRSRRSARPSPTPARTSPACARARSSMRRRGSGSSTARRR